MSDDFIREVDEELRRERITQIWKQYNGIILGGIFAVVLVVGGHSFWQRQKITKMTNASVEFSTALQLYAQENGRENGDKALQPLLSENTDGYGMLSRFRLAASLAMQDKVKAAELYDQIAQDNKLDAKWRELAEFRASALRIDGNQAETAAGHLQKLAEGTGAWRHSARDLLFAYAIQKGDYPQAQKWIDAMAKDSETPDGIRTALADYSSLASGGALGTVQEASEKETPAIQEQQPTDNTGIPDQENQSSEP